MLLIELPNILRPWRGWFYLYREKEIQVGGDAAGKAFSAKRAYRFCLPAGDSGDLAAHGYQKSQNDKAATRLYKGVKLLKKSKSRKKSSTPTVLATAHRELGEMDKSGTFWIKHWR